MYDYYYSPEKVGLELVGEISWSDEDWQFDLTAVWKKSRGKYLVASDSGCSCPAPFEDLSSESDMEGPYTKAQLKTRLETMINGYDSRYGNSRADLHRQKNEILSRLH